MRAVAFITACALLLGGCGGDGGTSPAATPSTPAAPTTVFSVPAQVALGTVDVQQVIAQAASEATARGLPAVIAVTDRVGNVLAVYRMAGAKAMATTSAAPNGVNVDAQNVTFPAEAGAIAKAVTGAYLSSGGNAFSTRTASQIVQPHYPPSPSSNNLSSGPLFGVQFSQLPCSDLAARFGAVGSAALIGPKRSPLGLAADPGGFPLYKGGVLVGGVGVMADGVYGFDPNIQDVDSPNDEEFIALAGTIGFDAPATITADRITAGGVSLRYSDATSAGFKSTSTTAFAALPGALVGVTGYATATVSAGTPYGSEASGVRAATIAEFSNRDAFVLSDGAGGNRYPIKAGTDAAAVATPLSAAEVKALLEEAFTIMSRARAQIRQPLDSRAQVSISVVDTYGANLGLVRSPDAPIFGIDVSLQKARTAAFFSHPQAASLLLANPSADVKAMVAAYRSFVNDANALNGSFDYSARAHGLLSRPFFPDGEDARPNGPFSRPIAQFNPFSTGLQSALIIGNIGAHLGYVTGASGTDTPARCTATPAVSGAQNPLQNGIQIFPGAVPIYRGNVLVGALGVSGDGVDQDDMIAFLGTSNGSKKAGSISNAPAAMRADQLIVPVAGTSGARLLYVNCPFAPFLDVADQNVCQGL